MAAAACDARYDAMVAGAGIAGCAAAAALSSAGLSVLVVEPGQHAQRRLSGELLHPPGLAGLRALGFSLPVAGAAVIRGFHVAHERGEGAPTVLPYPETGDGASAGMAMDHGALRVALGEQLRRMPGVTLLTGLRVGELDLADRADAVALLRGKHEAVRVRAGIVVAADGASSPLRAKVGIAHRRRPLSVLLGVTATSVALPDAGFGHFFLGTPRPVLAYPMGEDRARIMFDLPLGCADTRRAALGEAVAGLPERLRQALDPAEFESGLHCVSHAVGVEAVVRGRVALVGDAAGSCHPLTATGMTMAVTDALCLRAALGAFPDRPRAALAFYRRRRRAAWRTRQLIAAGLYEACSASDPGAQLMRRGLLRYWQSDARSRATSMALLALADVRPGMAAREMLKVALHGAAVPPPGRPRGPFALLPIREPRLMLDLAGWMGRHMQAALWAR